MIETRTFRNDVCMIVVEQSLHGNPVMTTTVLGQYTLVHSLMIYSLMAEAIKYMQQYEQSRIMEHGA